MKKIIILLLFANFAFSQSLEKVNTYEPIQSNSIEVDGTFLAKADIYAEYAELHFLDSETQASISLALELEQFDQIALLTTGYNAKDKDLYRLELPGSQFCIRFEGKDSQVQAHLFLMIGGSVVNFPDLNKVQLRRLFKR